MLAHLIKKYLIWMLLSYIIIYGIAHTFIIIPQITTIEKYRAVKAQAEYNYMKMTGSPAFLNSLETTIKNALIKTQDFEWVENEDVNPTLAFYNYIYILAKKRNLKLIEMSCIKELGGQKTQKAQSYHIWDVRFNGSFQNLLKFIEEVETGRKFVIIEEITVTQSRQENKSQPIYNMVFLCLKKGAYGKKTTAN